jgi:hypothetical protein
MRIERDMIGEMHIDGDAYYGIHTARALQNFAITGVPVHTEVTKALVTIKKAAAITNRDIGTLDKRIAGAIIAACDEILANPLYMMQMVEEADRNDPLIPLKKQYKAFSYYHLPDGRVVGLWKHALTSISADGGKTWAEPVQRARGFVNSNAKIWGQSTSDGKFATVYNPSEYRWPLAVSTSKDGLEYTDLMLVHGEITAMRYGGQYKSYGPQYVRGI